MLTDLVEGGSKKKVKAHQYWPDKEKQVMYLDNGVRLVNMETSYQGIYLHRYLMKSYAYGTS